MSRFQLRLILVIRDELKANSLQTDVRVFIIAFFSTIVFYYYNNYYPTLSIQDYSEYTYNIYIL